MELITREQARERGLTRFYTGTPCINGHDSERRVSSGTCIRCIKLATRAWLKKEEQKNRPDLVEKRKQSSRAWAERHPERKEHYQKGYYERRKEASKHALHHICLIYAMQGGRCMGCNRVFNDDLPITVDHVEPVYWHGSNQWTNKQLLCSPCNINKGTRNNDEWVRDPDSRPRRMPVNKVHPLMFRTYFIGNVYERPVDPQLDLFSLDTPPPPVS